MKNFAKTAFVFLFFIVSSEALALVNLAAVGGISMANQSLTTNQVTNLSVSSKSYLAYGFIGNLKFPGKNLGLTVGAQYGEMGSHQTYASGGVNYSIDEKAPYYQFPVTLDYWLGNFLALGVGGYYATPGGNITDNGTAVAASTSTTVNTSNTFSAANYISSDYGFVAHAQLIIPIGAVWMLTANAYYLSGFQNVATNPGSTEKNSSVQIEGGIGISL
jgi:hypothetical protein